jgi:hypothetical protein
MEKALHKRVTRPNSHGRPRAHGARPLPAQAREYLDRHGDPIWWVSETWKTFMGLGGVS